MNTTRKTRRVAAPIAAAAAGASLLALTGCGSSPAPAQAPPSAASIARQLGCTGVQPIRPPTLYAYDEADATCDGHGADIATFRTDQLRDNWVRIADQFSSIRQTGHLYAVADA
jgi:hypothetical protein